MPRFLPDILPKAPARNIAAVRGRGVLPVHILESADASEAFERRRVCAEALGTLAAPETTAAVTSWADVLAEANGWVLAHVDDRDFSRYASLSETEDRHGQSREMSPSEAKEHIKKVACDGNTTAVAFLEVFGEVLKDHEFADPNREIAQIARNSQGLVVEWARLEGQMDYRLAYALARPKPRDSNRVFENLHFDPSFFVEKNGRLVIDPRQTGRLRDHKGHPLVPRRQRKHLSEDPLFGCAGLHMVPRLVSKIIADAENGGRFGADYEQARART